MYQMYDIAPNVDVSLHWHKNSTVTARLFSEGKIVEKRLIAGWKEAEDVFASVVTMASDWLLITPTVLLHRKPWICIIKFWLGIKKNVSGNTWRVASCYTCLWAGIFSRL